MRLWCARLVRETVVREPEGVLLSMADRVDVRYGRDAVEACRRISNSDRSFRERVECRVVNDFDVDRNRLLVDDLLYRGPSEACRLGWSVAK